MAKPIPKLLYRGVDKAHPFYELALQGIAPARGTVESPSRHNDGETGSSLYVSFSASLEVAVEFATNDSGAGVVLVIESSEHTIVNSPDKADEQEYLVKRGTHIAKIHSFV